MATLQRGLFALMIAGVAVFGTAPPVEAAISRGQAEASSAPGPATREVSKPLDVKGQARNLSIQLNVGGQNFPAGIIHNEKR